jgi:hypothetical protein
MSDVAVNEDDFAVRLLRRFLALCESPRMQAIVVRRVGRSAGSAGAGRVLYKMISRLVVNPVARATGVHASAMRTELIASQLVGIALLRYVVKAEPMASASVDEVVELAAPAVRAALSGAAAGARPR